ncbi:PA0069 family radical SAM protein [uncultured Enterovirga sp.]|uniref:PA0069 family radical SAM protein n=1 Tax=uncultured Enterovirga sp. TaxID=2026352 RepID=UPI0035CC71E0
MARTQLKGTPAEPPRPAQRGVHTVIDRRRPDIRTYEGVERERRHGRGVGGNPDGRFEPIQRERAFDGWDFADEPLPIRTEVTLEKPRTIIARNDSPDISFDRSVNPYRGCEHGCVYCFARPSHAYQGLSPGLDFETKLFAKPNAAELLRKELAASNYEPKTMALGTNTDPYQPIERTYRITRSILEVLDATNHPVGIVTKSALVTRDIDILASMAERGLAKVAISVTTLDPKLARRMEPRAATPTKRLSTIRMLAEAGIPVSVLVAPIIPAINDHEIEGVLRAAYAAGAREAGYVMLRLPNELKGLVRDWLAENYPDRMKHVLSLVEDTRGGKLYDSAWGERQTGVGPYAWMIGRRFEAASERIGFNKQRRTLRTDLFTPPMRQGAQLALF